MSLETPDKIRMLQKKLYLKAKAEPNYRFYLLYDKIHREDLLRHAYELAKSNQGAPGVDEQTFEQIESAGRQEWLEGLGKQLREKTYRPQPVRKVMIPKPGGGERPLGIPTIGDRVAQTAVKLVLEPPVRSPRVRYKTTPTVTIATAIEFRRLPCKQAIISIQRSTRPTTRSRPAAIRTTRRAT